MSGKFLARASALSLAVFLAACGGDDSSTPLVQTPGNTPQTPGDTVQDGGSDQGDVDGGTDGGDSGTDTGLTTAFQIGTGETDMFVPGRISANTNTLTIGSEEFGKATLTLNIVDPSQGNALAKVSENSVSFSSQCSVASSEDTGPWASFGSEQVPGSEGVINTIYTPTEQCLKNNGGKDVVTARLNGDDYNTATLEVNLIDQASAPSVALGSFDGTNFKDKEIGLSSGTLVVGQNSVSTIDLSLSLVDPSKNNALATGSTASVTFSSVCALSSYASISPVSIPLSEGKVLASYTASLECLEANGGEDVITAKLEGQDDLEATATITLVEKQTAIGFFNGSTFNSGQIQFNGSATAGQSTPISVSIVDLDTPVPHDLVKSSQNSVSYSSTCSRAGWASFAPQSISGDDGLTPTTYIPTEACVSNNDGKDKITAKLNYSDDVIAEVELAVVSGTSSTPSLEFGAFTATPIDPTPSFRNRVVALASDTASVGEALPISVSIVDPNNAYALVKDSDTEVTFSSSCSGSGYATFDPPTVSGSEGKVLSAYTPSQACLDAGDTDTLRATLKTGDQTFTAEAPVTLQNQSSAQKAILASLQSSPANLTIGNSATISTRIIDPDTGDLVKQSDNSVSFSSVCSLSDDATFSPASVSGQNGVVYTTYTPTQACLDSLGEDVITARLNDSDEIEKTTAIILTSLPAATDPVLGSTDGSGKFTSGEIKASPSTNLTIDDPYNGQATVTLTIADPDNADQPLAGEVSNVTFFSACISSGWASMDNLEVSTEAGEVRAIYTPGSQCVGEDKLYAKLNDDSEKLASVTFTNTPIVQPPEPVIEVGSLDGSGNFQPEVIRVINPALTLDANGEASTDLIVNIQSDGQPASVTPYTAQFTSMCIDAGRASINGSNTTQSGAILATYKASPDCLGTDNVVVFLNGDSTLKASADIIVSDTKLTIGSCNGDSDSYCNFTGSLSASKSELDYNTEAEPSTEIRSVIAKVDDFGIFIEQLIGFQSSIEFFSTCLDSGLATIESTGTTESGELVSTYRPQGCVGTETLYGRIAGTNEIASTQIEITPKVEQVLLLGRLDPYEFTDRKISKSRETALPVGAQTRLYLSLVDKADELNRLIGQPLSVQLNSTCEGVDESDSPFATSILSMSTGYAEVLYTAQACGSVEVDTVTATLTGADGLSATAKTTITLNKDDVAHSLTASQPEPNSIAPGEFDGTYEGRTSTSLVRFQLKNKDGTGTNMANKTVSFRLDDPSDSGITLTPATTQTDENGFVTVTVKAEMDAPNSVFRVIATYESLEPFESLETFSAPIAVNSRLPFVSKFSLGTSNFAPDTRAPDTVPQDPDQPSGKNGVRVELTLLAADYQGNRIRGNTVVRFTTDQGSIDPECILDDNGRCTVTWESLSIDDTFATVRAYTLGRLADEKGDPAGTGEIESFTQMLMSTSDNVQVSLKRTFPMGVDIDSESNTYCATTWVTLDGDKFSPPSGTEILFELTEGEFINEASSSNTIPSSRSLLTLPGYEACTKVRPAETVEEIEISDGSGGVKIVEQTTLDIELSVTVIPPADIVAPATDYITETYQF